MRNGEEVAVLEIDIEIPQSAARAAMGRAPGVGGGVAPGLLAGRQAAVDHDLGAGREGGVLARREQDRPRDLVGLRKAAERGRAGVAGARLLRISRAER